MTGGNVERRQHPDDLEVLPMWTTKTTLKSNMIRRLGFRSCQAKDDRYVNIRVYWMSKREETAVRASRLEGGATYHWVLLTTMSQRIVRP